MKTSKIAKRFHAPKENILMEIGALASHTDNLINLSIGDPDLITDEKIIDAAMTAAKAGHTKYTASEGSQELLAAIQKFYQTQYGLAFELNQIWATVGALHGIYLAFQAILDPGDEVIIHEPYFSPYKDQVIFAGGVPVFVPTYEKDDFQLDVSLLEAAITPKTKAILLNSPNNPTGAVFSKETFQAIADLAIKHDLLILSDEVYEAFTYYEDFMPMASFAPENTITFGSFSKAFAMTGWRLGYMIGPADINAVAKMINESVAYSAPTLSQRAGIYGLEHYAELVPQVTNVFQERLEYIEKRVAENPFLSLRPIKGSIYAYINIAKTGLDSVAFTEKLLKETKVLVIPGKAFGETTGDQHVRLAATQNLEILREAFDRIDQLTF
ncbi:pyridoxal phosphate-dependent aminotransferase [Enterococcus sp. LJL120]